MVGHRPEAFNQPGGFIYRSMRVFALRSILACLRERFLFRPQIWTTSALRLAVEAAGVALWSWNIRTDELSLDEAARRLWGVSPSDTEVSFEDLSAHIHPADRDRVRHAFYATRAVSGRYEIDFRILYGESSGGSRRGARAPTPKWSQMSRSACSST